ncbi:sigma-70 family RNA polymerase sigma factor [Flagellimonas alvinocaridis]|uniref:Sigma-70 family RNA polymerase sigma factor n=1 Tax=Flagellimonas alvinocaridis TaxID=2530200 RepID=A0A4S8RID4_9FLAO|nr:sigma-70 family RNA polymerase sigma factor [Allomuricauda alvinocaridis]THV58158.1 sigma-70 family RNA polymerase sigma factor [Allomuricauda alvinocaridis]
MAETFSFFFGADRDGTHNGDRSQDGNAPMTDLQLWTAFQRGNETAYATIYQENADRLYGYGMKLVRDRELVMDAIQDLFVELWDAKERLGKVRAIKSYLYRSIRRKVIDRAGKRRKQLFPIDEEEMEPTPSTESSLIEEQRKEEGHKGLQKALAQLNPRQREVIHLKYYARLDYGEIAEIMGTDKKAVYNLMARAIHQMRQHMDTWAYLGFVVSLLRS